MSNRNPKRLPAGVACLLLVLASAAPAGIENPGTVDGGGGRTAAGNCVLDSSVGGISGIAASAVSGVVARQGFIGQLAETTQLVVFASPGVIAEGGTVRLSGLAVLDDTTVTALAGSNIQWCAPVFPLAGIAPVGLATAATVSTNTSGMVTGTYLGVTGFVAVLVLDRGSDVRFEGTVYSIR